MGTTYKGNATHYRSISENISQTALKYPYHDGYFGVDSPRARTRDFVKIIASDDPIATATDFYNRIAYGGLETIYDDIDMKITEMADGTYITWRKTSTSDGSPAVDINIVDGADVGGIKYQKIHFVEV